MPAKAEWCYGKIGHRDLHQGCVGKSCWSGVSQHPASARMVRPVRFPRQLPGMHVVRSSVKRSIGPLTGAFFAKLSQTDQRLWKLVTEMVTALGQQKRGASVECGLNQGL
jgi:hypothetical protein